MARRKAGAGVLLLVIGTILLSGLVSRSQTDSEHRIVDGEVVGLQAGGRKAPKYVGWKLEDDAFGNTDPRNARIVFYIMVAGKSELPGLEVLLQTLYHRDHFFLLHVDVKAIPEARREAKKLIEQMLLARGNGYTNIRLVEPAMPVTWGGFTMTLNAVYGLTQALHWTSKWDYFINLSASDLPLLPADEISTILGEHKGGNTSFISGFKYRPAWEGFKFIDRREMFAEDRALVLDTEQEKRWPWAILDDDKNMLLRPKPDLFTVYKGEFWVILHRSMATYIHKSPDNQARALLAYFSGMIVSDEEFFQTVACNPRIPPTLPAHDDNLRFVNWWGDGASPAAITPERVLAAAHSGALFGRKFSTATPEAQAGVTWVQHYLAKKSRSTARMSRVRRRLKARMGPDGVPNGFCNRERVKHPPEAYFAVDGEEETLGDRRRLAGAREGERGERLETLPSGDSAAAVVERTDVGDSFVSRESVEYAGQGSRQGRPHHLGEKELKNWEDQDLHN